MKPLDKPELERFLAAAKGSPLEDLFFVAFFTGMREGELLGLQWSCIDFKRGTIRVEKQLQRPRRKGDEFYFSSLKNDKERIITPAPDVMKVLREHKRKQNEARLKALLWDCGAFPDLVFTNEIGGHLIYAYLLNQYKKILTAAGLEQRRFHDARHTYATLSLLAGDDIKTISANLGHATVAFTLDQYAHYVDTMREVSAGKMQALIDSLNRYNLG
jgi:integrase